MTQRFEKVVKHGVYGGFMHIYYEEKNYYHARMDFPDEMIESLPPWIKVSIPHDPVLEFELNILLPQSTRIFGS